MNDAPNMTEIMQTKIAIRLQVPILIVVRWIIKSLTVYEGLKINFPKELMMDKIRMGHQSRTQERIYALTQQDARLPT